MCKKERKKKEKRKRTKQVCMFKKHSPEQNEQREEMGNKVRSSRESNHKRSCNLL